jgi:hypothetical protein
MISEYTEEDANSFNEGLFSHAMHKASFLSYDGALLIGAYEIKLPGSTLN